MSNSGIRSRDSLELSTLLQQGEAAARVGDRAEAETLLRRAVDEYPHSEDAWLALAGVVDDLAEKRAILQRVQQLNPASEEARLGLERLEVKLGPAPETETGVGVEAVLCECGSGRMTVLRCSKCGKPICPQCSVRHPVGLRCKECAAVRKSPVYSLSFRDYVVAGVVGVGLSMLAAIVMGFLPGGGLFFYLQFLIGFAVGGGIADFMSRSIRYKRGMGMQILAGVCIVLGAFLVPFALAVLPVALRTGVNLFYLIAAVVGAVGRLR